jgi:signal transduction histidine kinase/CheY-like chemotaxis protein
MHATARVYETGASETHEYTLLLAVGPRTFEAKIERIGAVDGPEPFRAVALIRDITEEKAIERKLAEAERLAALGVLAAGIGHEINNPLMVVQENARFVAQALGSLAEQPTADAFAASVRSMRHMLDDIVNGSQRMKNIVDDLRLFRREDSPDLAAVDVRAAVATAIDIARMHIDQRAVLERDIAAVPRVLASDGKLSQVFLNLVINAAQSIPDGDARAQRLRVTTRTDARGWAVVEVSDTGCGISAADMAKVFDPFFTTKREGMGLGLSICRQIITSYGGTIEIESEVGRGTTFRVSLPPHAGASQEASGPRPSEEQQRLPRLRLLVIDDEPALLRVFKILVSEEHDVVTADGCDAALDILRVDAAFDAILCDLMMPLGDGISFHERLGRIQPALQSRIIFMTGGAYTERARTFLESVPNPTLGKPFTHESLRRLLCETRC